MAASAFWRPSTDRSMTVAALPGYLEGLRERGVEVLTLSELSALSGEQ